MWTVLMDPLLKQQQVQANCSIDLAEFETTEYVVFIRSTEPSNNELAVLETSFIWSPIIKLMPQTKTPVTHYFVLPNQPSFWEHMETWIKKLESTGSFAYNVTTVYYCRGCGRDDYLFADSSVWHLGLKSSIQASTDQQGATDQPWYTSRLWETWAADWCGDSVLLSDWQKNSRTPSNQGRVCGDLWTTFGIHWKGVADVFIIPGYL
jgi:hypothetical protein